MRNDDVFCINFTQVERRGISWKQMRGLTDTSEGALINISSYLSLSDSICCKNAIRMKSKQGYKKLKTKSPWIGRWLKWYFEKRTCRRNESNG
jgi:hypothetical protein